MEKTSSNALSLNTTSSASRSLVPAAWKTSVRAIGPSEYAAAGLSLAHSFASDALSHYLLDGDDMADTSDEQKWKIHASIMKYTVAAFGRNGFVTTIGPDLDAVALWLPPRKQIDGLWTILRSGMWRLYYQLSSESRRRWYTELLPGLHHAMDEVMGDSDFYYLGYIGTKTTARGKGYARKLILDVAQKADRENLPLYLESSDTRNNPYYKKFGFEFRKELVFSSGPRPVTLYILVRQPQRLESATSSPPATVHVEQVNVA